MVLGVFIHALSTLLSLQHLDTEGVLLVAAHVGITHEVQGVLVTAQRRRCSEV